MYFGKLQPGFLWGPPGSPSIEPPFTELVTDGELKRCLKVSLNLFCSCPVISPPFKQSFSAICGQLFSYVLFHGSWLEYYGP
ncbi:hypothetical protein LDENG_00219910 [Lucifuga dentata]|nr:hypothetical protein LDENG_00219910 [Lucifuga dentata]